MAATGIPSISTVYASRSVVNAHDYGIKGDARYFVDGAITSGQAVLTSATAAFTAADVGKAVCINAAGASSAVLTTTVSVFTNATTVTLAANASATVTGAYCAIGTENTTALQNALDSTNNGSRSVSDAGITSSAATLSSASANFTIADIGSRVKIAGAGTSGAVFYAHILAVLSSTSVTVSTTAGTTVSSAACTISSSGGTCFVPGGNYLFTGNLIMPFGVTLQGTYQAPPAHQGNPYSGGTIINAGSFTFSPMGGGTTLLITGGSTNASGTPFIQMPSFSTVAGLVFFYPCQPLIAGGANAPVAYPWTVQMNEGANQAAINCEFLNPYQMINCKGSWRPLLWNLCGQPYSIGVQIDNNFDVAKLGNIHFECYWDGTSGPTPPTWQQANGIGFNFFRCDDLNAVNLFVYGMNYGFVLNSATNTAVNGAWAEFSNCSADGCNKAVVVDYVQVYGVRFTCCTFTFNQIQAVFVGGNNAGTVDFSNCLFIGPNGVDATVAGSGNVSFDDCTFGQFGSGTVTGIAVAATGGGIQITNCRFVQSQPQINLSSAVSWALVTSNRLGPGGNQITNSIASSSDYVVTNNLAV